MHEVSICALLDKTPNINFYMMKKLSKCCAEYLCWSYFQQQKDCKISHSHYYIKHSSTVAHFGQYHCKNVITFTTNIFAAFFFLKTENADKVQ